MDVLKSKTKGRKVVRVHKMKEPKMIQIHGSVYWEAKDRMFPEHEYGRAHRYANGQYVGKFK